MPEFPEGYTSYEAWIESKAGASPARPCGCDFPNSPECACDTSCLHCWPDFAAEILAADAVEFGIRTGRCGPYAVEHGGDWPMPEPPPYPADDENDTEPQP